MSYTPITKFDRVVAKEMGRYGFDFELVRNTEAEDSYDPATSEFIETNETFICRGLLFDYTLQRNGTKTSADLVQAGDKQLYIQPPIKAGSPNPITTIFPERDRVKIGTDLYRIITFKEVNPSTADSCLWECYIRK